MSVKRLAPCCLPLVVAVCLAPVVGAIPTFSNMVVIADSLADPGNLFLVDGGAFPPSPPYFGGRFTNGPTWVELLAPQIGAPPSTPFLTGGSNYAFGGAQTGFGNSVVNSPNLGSQLQTYLSAHTPSPTELFVLNGAPNDFLLAGETNPAVTATNLANLIRSLYNAGAREFLVPNLPDLTTVPGIAENIPSPFVITPANIGARSGAFNSIFGAQLDVLQATLPGIEIHRLDLAGLLNDVRANPAAYGLTNVTDPVLTPTGLAGNPDQYLWWDAVHPTARVHQAIAARALEAVSMPLPSGARSGLLTGGSAIALIGISRRRRRAA